MAGLLILQGLGLITAATTPAVPPHTVTAEPAPAASTAPVRARTRDERIGAVALRGFPTTEGRFPPAQSWGEGRGPILEVGALGARRSGRPDLAHLSLDWQF